MVDELFAAQKQVLSNVYVKGRRDFLCCRRSQFYQPELVVLSSGHCYVDRGQTTCKRILYCSACNKAYLYKKSLEIKKIEEYIQQRDLHPTMLTLHVPHKSSDGLKYLRVALDKAVRSFLSDRRNESMRKFNQFVGNEGYLFRSDITFSDNSGWNPHYHVLMLNNINYSEQQKNQFVDEFARHLEQAGLYLSRLNKYYKGNLIHFREDSISLSYLTKYNKELMELAVTNPTRYIELAQSGNKTRVPPLIALKRGLMNKVDKFLGMSEPESKNEVNRIVIPESFLSLSVKEIAERCSCLI